MLRVEVVLSRVPRVTNVISPIYTPSLYKDVMRQLDMVGVHALVFEKDVVSVSKLWYLYMESTGIQSAAPGTVIVLSDATHDPPRRLDIVFAILQLALGNPHTDTLEDALQRVRRQHSDEC